MLLACLTIYQRQRKPDATARNHAAREVVARAPAPQTNQPAATVRGGAGPRPTPALQSAPAAGGGRGPGRGAHTWKGGAIQAHPPRSITPSPPLAGPAAPGLPGTPQ